MKTLLLVATAAFAGVVFLNQKPKPDPTLAHREQASREHRITIAMTREEVTRSLGAPEAERTTPDGQVIWTWKSGQWVKFAGRALVDSGIEGPSMTKQEAQIEAAGAQAASAQIPKPKAEPGYHYEWSPASRRWVPVRDGSSWRKSIGGG